MIIDTSVFHPGVIFVIVDVIVVKVFKIEVVLEVVVEVVEEVVVVVVVVGSP